MLVTFESRTQASESVARVVVSNVQVRTAGTRFDQEKARQDNRPIPTSVVTLLVTPEDAQRVALAAAEGRLTLILRNPLDNAPTESAGIRAGGLMGHPTPPPPVAAPRSTPRPSVAAAPVVPPPPPPAPVPGRGDPRREADDRAHEERRRREAARRAAEDGESPVMTCVFALSTLLLPGVLGLAPGAPAPPPAPAPGAAATVPAQCRRRPANGRLNRDRVLMLTAGRSMVLTTYDITRIAITDPKIADAVVVQPREVLIDGRSAGSVSLIVWASAGATVRRRRRSRRDDLAQTLQQIFPGEDIRVAMNGDAVILSGQVSTNAVMLPRRRGRCATKANARVVKMLQLPGGMASQQVMLQVRFAEVNRAALMEAGLTFFGNARQFAGRTTTQQLSGPVLEDEETRPPHGVQRLPQPFFFDKREGLGAVLKALESKGYFQSLAEPNLIAYNGQEASCLAGGDSRFQSSRARPTR